MGRSVIVAEKPSVGRDIARVLGCTQRGNGCLMNDQYIVTWARGHLVTLCEPDEIDSRYKRWSWDTLPIVPQSFPLKVIRDAADQYKIVTSFMNDPQTDSVICATDAGREGELIFRNIYAHAQCKKPLKRLWISSMTDEAIQEGFRAIKPGSDYDGLYASALCRSQADWLVGMNASRAFTLKFDVLLSVGRVQTPTLAILVKRRLEIEHFQPDIFATLTADFGDYKGVLFQKGLDPDTHLPSKEIAQQLVAQLKGKQAVVLSAETTQGRELPPQLFDLTSLQREANKIFGFTAEKTLKVAQSLYETRKALTYPRTDSRYLPPDMVPRVVKTMQLLPENYQKYVSGALPNGQLPVTKRTIDETKVTDHHAILPTAQRVKPESFSEDERKLYDLVVRRMLQAFYPACEYDATKIITQVEDQLFRTTGRVIRKNGWHDVETPEVAPRKKGKTAPEEDLLPPLSAGDTRTVKSFTVKEDKTKPPAQMNDASLLDAMENAGKESDDASIAKQMKGSGIGTPATRAAIIERLIQVRYVKRDGKKLVATDKGVQMIGLMPPEITSPETTGQWELALERIAEGKQDAKKFMESIARFSAFLVSYAHNSQARPAFEDERAKRRKGAPSVTGTPIPSIPCPLCGGKKLHETQLAFSCKSPCHFVLWKDCLTRGGGPMLTEKLLTLLIEKKTVSGSTGTIVLGDGQIAFYPLGAERPSVIRSLAYERKSVEKR